MCEGAFSSSGQALLPRSIPSLKRQTAARIQMNTSAANTISRSRPGFALVAALALMGFLLLLLTGLSTLLKVESQRTQHELNTEKARQNALLGLKKAIAQIQTNAGIDQIATIRADSFEQPDPQDPAQTITTSPEKLLWTGVVPTNPGLTIEEATDSARWLVSYGEVGTQSLSIPLENSVRLLGNPASPDSLSAHAPLAPVTESQVNATGYYAYWVSDESMKAKLNLTNPPPADPADSKTSRIPLQAAQRFGTETIDALTPLTQLYADPDLAGQAAVGRMNTVNDLYHLEQLATPIGPGDQTGDLTTHSWGLLTDARFGGLRTDLTTLLRESNNFNSWDLVIPEDRDDFIAAGSPTQDPALRIFLRQRRGPSWSLLQDFTQLHRRLGANGDTLEPTVSHDQQLPLGGQSMPDFPQSVTIGPVLLYQGLSLGLKLEPEMTETIAIARLSQAELMALAEPDGSIAPSTVDQHPAIELFERTYLRLHLTIEPVVALWNPYDVRLSPQDYLAEFTFSNELRAAQPALTLQNSSINEWIRLNSSADYDADGPANVLYPDPLNGHWRLFIGDRMDPYDDWQAIFNPRERDFLSNETALNSWNVHLNEVLPGFSSLYSDLMELNPFGRQISDYNSYHGGSSPGAKSLNLHFAIPAQSFEPGEIRWFSLPQGLNSYEPEDRKLQPGLNAGYLKFPIEKTAGWRVRSDASNLDESDDVSIGRWRYLPPAFETGTTNLRHEWIDTHGQPRPAIDIGLVIHDEPVAGNHTIGGVGADGISVGLGQRTGQYGILLRMLDPELRAGAAPLESYLEHPFGSNSSDVDRFWQPLKFATVNPGGNSGIFSGFYESFLEQKTELLSTGVFMVGPNQTTVNYRLDHNSGIKIVSAHNVVSRYHGWNEFRDASLGSTGESRLGFGISAPTYGFALETAPVFAFDAYELWHEAAIVSMSGDDPEFRAVLFHIPRDELFSMGQLQHLSISRSPWDPTYPIANSLASPWIPADATMTLFVRDGSTNFPLHDRSYYLNRALLDSYYFSTWNPSEADSPRNPRLQVVSLFPTESAFPAEREISAHLMINGPFNVNSTSVAAWSALLSSMNLQSIEFKDAASGTSFNQSDLENPFLRSPMPTGGTATQPQNGGFPLEDTAYWRGFRELDSSQIRELAEAIVTEIRNRGPFRTVAEFINREVTDASSPTALKGAIQAAIDEQSRTSQNPINPNVDFGNATLSGGGIVNTGNYAFAEAAVGPRHEAAPGYLMQADVLSPLLPILTARADTFLIRSYGNIVDPESGAILGQAWCEAVVQRLAEFIDETDAPPTATDNLSALNTTFGRRFVVQSFRWLREDEL